MFFCPYPKCITRPDFQNTLLNAHGRQAFAQLFGHSQAARDPPGAPGHGCPLVQDARQAVQDRDNPSGTDLTQPRNVSMHRVSTPFVRRKSDV